MASALTALENATATFTVAGASLVTDADTGNVAPAAATVTCSLYLRAENVETRTYPGVNQVETFYEGYVTSGALDSRIVVGTAGTLAFGGDNAIPCEVMGLRLPYGSTGLLGDVLGTALGEKVMLVSRGA